MGEAESKFAKLAKDFENSKRIAEIPSPTVFDTENDAKIYAEFIREKDTVVEITSQDDKFAVTKHLLPPLWLGVFTIRNPAIMKRFQSWAHLNGYCTSIDGNIISIGSSISYSFSMSPGIPEWYRNVKVSATSFEA